MACLFMMEKLIRRCLKTITGRVGVVVITLASHARGREFNPRIRYFSFRDFNKHVIALPLIGGCLFLQSTHKQKEEAQRIENRWLRVRRSPYAAESSLVRCTIDANSDHISSCIGNHLDHNRREPHKLGGRTFWARFCSSSSGCIVATALSIEDFFWLTYAIIVSGEAPAGSEVCFSPSVITFPSALSMHNQQSATSQMLRYCSYPSREQRCS